MNEYWANVYVKEGEAEVGLNWNTRKDAEAMARFVQGASYRIHVKLKEQSK